MIKLLKESGRPVTLTFQVFERKEIPIVFTEVGFAHFFLFPAATSTDFVLCCQMKV